MKGTFTGIVLIICLTFFLVGLYEAYEGYRDLRSHSNTIGIVTENSYQVTTQDGYPSGSHHPVVEFQDADGNKRVFTDGIGSLPPDYEPGTKIEVVYDPAATEKARIYSWKRFWLAPCIFMAVGLIPFLIFILIIRKIPM